MVLSGKTQVAGVMGWPVAHSRSPRLHGFWLERHGVDGAYVPLPVPPDGLERALRALPLLGLRGVNLTVPHKEAALAICDRVDDVARRIGAVNTVVVEPDGRLAGSNTDAFGFAENLRANSGWQAKGAAVVIGAGGAARAVVVALLEAGVKDVRVVNRTAARAESLAAAFGRPVVSCPWADRHDLIADAALLVNATSLGMTGQPPLELDLALLPREAIVSDIVYVPLETALLRQARARGNATVDGLGMLLHQARPGFEAWFGVRPEVTEELRRFVAQDLG